MTLAERIYEVLAKSPTGLKARQIAKLINEDRHAVNRFLYSHPSDYSVNSHDVWTLNRKTANPTKLATPPKSYSAPIDFERCCYANNICSFLSETEHSWLDIMQNNFSRIMPLAL